MLLRTRTSTRLILSLSLALTVGLPTVRAHASPDGLHLYLSDAIPADSAAMQAAIRFANDRANKLHLQVQSLKLQPGKFPRSGIVLAPLPLWSQQIPSLTVLRLPFYYPDLNAVHKALRNKLGQRLVHTARKAGWKLLAFWDDGMTDFSGNQDYSKLLNLSGMQFALWRPDALQAKELRALNTWSRVIRKNGVKRNAQQCIVDSRSTTPTQMWRERLQRVHLDITLTHDRYAGYVMAIPLTAWHRLGAEQHKTLQQILASLTRQERQQAAHAQQQALAALHRAGMAIHHMSPAQRRIFMLRMPPWRDFLEHLNKKQVKNLLAAARTAATGRSGSPRKEALANSQPGANTAK